MNRNFSELVFISRVRQLFTGRFSREDKPSKLEKQAVREIKHSIKQDAASTTLLYSMLMLLQHYVACHGSASLQDRLSCRMAQYERGEVASYEVLADITVQIQEEEGAALDAEYEAHLAETAPDYLAEIKRQGLL